MIEAWNEIHKKEIIRKNNVYEVLKLEADENTFWGDAFIYMLSLYTEYNTDYNAFNEGVYKFDQVFLNLTDKAFYDYLKNDSKNSKEYKKKYPKDPIRDPIKYVNYLMEQPHS